MNNGHPKKQRWRGCLCACAREPRCLPQRVASSSWGQRWISPSGLLAAAQIPRVRRSDERLFGSLLLIRIKTTVCYQDLAIQIFMYFYFFMHALGFPPDPTLSFFCLDCGFVMCYGIRETTMKPDVLSNASARALCFFAEVGAGDRTAVQPQCENCNWARSTGRRVPFIPPLKISPVPLAERSPAIESHQAN